LINHKAIEKGDDKTVGLKYQKSMRDNLNKRSVLTFMMKDRANLETSKDLTKKADKAAQKEAGKKAKEELRILRRQIEENKDPSLLTALKVKEQELIDRIEEGKAVEEEERDEKFMSKLEEIEKKNEGGEKKDKGGGGEKKTT